jgi:hypothetical protein
MGTKYLHHQNNDTMKKEVEQPILPKDFFKQFKSKVQFQGFFRSLFKQGIEAMLEAEPDEHPRATRSTPRRATTAAIPATAPPPRRSRPRAWATSHCPFPVTATAVSISGFTQAIKAAFTLALTQFCIVHQIRNSCKFVPWSERREFATGLREIYSAVNENSLKRKPFSPTVMPL